MEKNVAGKWAVYAYGLPDHATLAGEPVTGDAANITANIRIDGGAANAVDDVNPTELEDGLYIFDITAVESNGDLLILAPESSTANVKVIAMPGAIYTRPPNFNALGVAADGDLSGDLDGAVVGNVGGNVVGSVGSVTGAVGSVTGAVGSVTAQVSANVTAISSDSTAADNLEAMYDGTGYTDDTAPASRSQLDQLVVTGSAVNVTARPEPDGFAITTGSVDANNEDATHSLNGVYHELSDTAGTLDCYYKFSIGGDAVPTSVTFTGVFNGGNDDFGIYANSGSSGTPVWDQIGTLEGTNSGSNVTHTFTMFTNQIVTDVYGEVWVRIYATGLTSSNFEVDQVFVSKAITNRSVGYALGAIWIDSGASNVNTENYVDGVADNPVSTWSAALTLSSQLGLKKFILAAGTSITLSGNSDNYHIIGYRCGVALNGQSIEGIRIEGADVSGTGLATTTAPTLVGCAIDTATLPPCCLDSCGLTSATVGSAGDFYIVDCYSRVAGAGAPTFDMGGAVGATNISIRRYGGGLSISNIATSDVISAEATVGGTLTLSGSAGTVEVRGGWKAVSSGSFSGTVTDVSVNTRFDTLDNTSPWDALRSSHNDPGTFGEEVPADMVSISGSSTAADNLEASSLGVEVGTVSDASPTATLFETDLTFVDDALNGRVVLFTSGNTIRQAAVITDCSGAASSISVGVGKLTTAPTNGASLVVL